MSKSTEGRELIQTLVRARFFAECPCCGEEVLLKDTNLFYLDDFTPAAQSVYAEALEELKTRRKGLAESKKSMTQTSMVTTKAVNIGFILERMAPVMDQFGFNHCDCRALFDPIDYVVFEGLRLQNKVSRIVFLDIKTGSARLSGKQQMIRSIVEKKHVIWDTYNLRSCK